LLDIPHPVTLSHP